MLAGRIALVRDHASDELTSPAQGHSPSAIERSRADPSSSAASSAGSRSPAAAVEPTSPNRRVFRPRCPTISRAGRHLPALQHSGHESHALLHDLSMLRHEPLPLLRRRGIHHPVVERQHPLQLVVHLGHRLRMRGRVSRGLRRLRRRAGDLSGSRRNDQEKRNANGNAKQGAHEHLRRKVESRHARE